MLTDYIDCNDCIHQSESKEFCNSPLRDYENYHLERAKGYCGLSAMNFQPKKHDPPVAKWQVICGNCTTIMMVLTSQIKTDAYDDLTIGEFRKQYPCLSKDCPARDIYGCDE